MAAWLEGFAKVRQDPSTSALDAYVWSHSAFVRIHPYADGNGRMARLLANLPVVEKGSLPILIPQSRRLDYVESLATWQFASGPPRPGAPLGGEDAVLEAFRLLSQDAQVEANAILTEVTELQRKRDEGN